MPKIIIADDSQTIQKVIKITLASENYDLVECLTDAELVSLAEKESPALILLDFNLSESKTGYDLAKEISDTCNAKVLMLYGTFDTIDESLFDEAGIDGHIVKPFDGTKFISLCRQLVSDIELEDQQLTNDEFEAEEFSEEDFETEELESTIIQTPDIGTNDYVEDFEDSEGNISESPAESPPQSTVEELLQKNSKNDIDDGWVVNQPQIEESSSFLTEDLVSPSELNTLEAGMKDWGVDVPGVIGVDAGAFELPPVIDESEIDEFKQVSSPFSGAIQVDEKQAEESILPKEDDLEYPVEIVTNDEPKFTPISELENITEPIKDNKQEARTIELDATLGTATEEEVQVLEKLIADEVEEDTVDLSSINSENLWETDEVVKEAVPSEINISEGQIEKHIEKMLQPIIEKLVNEKIESIIEKISWEIIPDLAENLIKKELKHVAEQVLSSDK